MKPTVAHLLLLLSTVTAAQSVTVQKSAPTDQDLTEEQMGTVVKLANLQKNVGKKMNSPGVDLSLREIDRTATSDRTLVKYELYAKGLPTDLTYTLLKVQISGKILKQLDGVTLDSNGRAICAGRKGTCSGSAPNSPIDLVFFAGKAEPIRLLLASNDDSHLKGFVSVIPFPNSVTDKSCKLESVLGTPKGEVTYVQGSGFEPNEELAMESESYGEKNHGPAKAEADGSYFAVTMPNVLGKTSGTTTWSVRGTNCNPTLTFTWGTYHLE
jgi:hypothetical protein